MLDTSDTKKYDTMLDQSILVKQLDETTYLVLREWNDATPYVIHYWTKEMGYFWGAYLPTSDLDKAKLEFYEKYHKIK
ncbi:hypothetical protein LCGC14_2396940 [marine sediment metagenome]|uniref:Uncharacterized protein n=1 Tax=marine sediment metagenome TaxID=412755 RepID=A0A0F9E8W7_9ZZZZ